MACSVSFSTWTPRFDGEAVLTPLPESPPAQRRLLRPSRQAAPRSAPRSQRARRPRDGRRDEQQGSRVRRSSISPDRAGRRLRVRAEAVRVEHEEERRARLTDPADRSSGRLVDRPRHRSCRARGLDAERRSARRDRACELELDRRRLRVVVVLDDEEHRKLPERGDVERLVRHTLAESAVTEEHGRDRPVPFVFSASAIPWPRGRCSRGRRSNRSCPCTGAGCRPCRRRRPAPSPSPRTAGRTRRP